MDEIILVEPSREYAEDLWAFRQEIIDADVHELLHTSAHE